MVKKFLKNSERGQAIILIALAIVGMIGMVGLMTDGGILLIEYARLKRGIDAASIAAALQYRQGFLEADLEAAAEEFLRLNQSDVSEVKIITCDTLPLIITDPDEYNRLNPLLCTTPKRKLVYVEATRIVTFGFMRVLGFNSTTISANSIGEAASIDLVLVMDTSASMAYETDPSGNPNQSGPGEDPKVCNASGADGTCEPMTTIKGIAEDFIETMFFPYDRVAIVTMTSQNDEGFRDPETKLALDDNYNVLGVEDFTVQNAIRDIRVYQPSPCSTLYGVCRDLCTQVEIDYANGDRDGNGIVTDPPNPPDVPEDIDDPCFGKPVDYYVGEACPLFQHPDLGKNPSSCTSSNVGGALYKAAEQFGDRKDSFWVVIALVGGPANATNPPNGIYYDLTDNDAPLGAPDDDRAFGYCPIGTWSGSDPFCRGADVSALTRHTDTNPLYDADDYARDAADFLANPATGQGVTIFTIGLGDLIQNATKGDADAGEQLLEYVARNAGDTMTVQASHGEYYFSPDPAGLIAIFDAIAENIFTRISK